jgi:hypothetical protein
MTPCLPIEGVPIAVPFALSHGRRSPLWDAAFRRITPGALAPVVVLLSLPGGRR